VIAFAWLVAKAPERPLAVRPLRAISQADGIPNVIFPEPRRRLARGSTAPAVASLELARARIGELQTRRLGTPLPSHDEGWDLIRTIDDNWE